MKTVDEFVDLVSERIAYDDQKKRKFHRLGKAVLKLVAKELGLTEGLYEIRSNKGGTAVSGEVILHHNRFYIQFYQTAFLGNCFLYRECDGQDDYCGKTNFFYKYEDLRDLGGFVQKIRKLTGI
jgi:hypothetical protein